MSLAAEAGAPRGPVPDAETPRGYERLPRTSEEMREVVKFYVASHPSAADPVRIRTFAGRLGAREAFLREAPRAGILYVGTHAEFETAPEASLAGERPRGRRPNSSSRLSPENRALELAPKALCGIVLAGANGPVGEDGRRPGFLTAEEVQGLDLRHCRLVILAVCDGNAGVPRDGQGIHSLVSAFHAAGARTVVSTLWPVDDEHAQDFVEEFTRRVLEKGTPASKAFQDARLTLYRRSSSTVRSWGPWILSGDPDPFAD